MKKIYLFVDTIWPNGDVGGMALGEDGEVISGHLSSDTEFLRKDLDTLYHKVRYVKHFPEGYEIVDLIDYPDSTDKGFVAALALNALVEITG